ncbi:WAT1-related protein At5g64700-like isoform X1 [Asparagus officinalis]|uniref:WAT1-related protein At5g64700-like isoform X1 n=1 Tax=Asparagus officinalis TaxID=4686 RepID=UPI00098E85AB|nr:WAT1-related protein At5g64700-like isoform X1 [Asparagus officinalis]
MAGERFCSENLKAPLSMIMVQVFTTAMLLLSKVVLTQGIFVFALLAYRHVVAAIFVAPFAFFFEREMWKKLTWRAMMWIFINALFGISLAMGMYFYGLRDTMAGYSSNFLNLIPILTFFFAVVVRIEKLGLDSKGGRVKVIGTVLCVGGAMIVSLYKGKVLHIWPSHMIIHQESAEESAQVHNMLRGTLLLLGSCTSYACWFIFQVKLYKVFPSKYWATTLTCVAGCFQTFIVGIVINRNMDAWKLKWDLQLLTIVCMGVFSTGAMFCLASWVISKKGPIYPPMFNSLSVVFTTILESVFMGQDITVGNLIGMFMIIGGLHAFLWGKEKELRTQDVKVEDISEPKHSQIFSKEIIVNKDGDEITSNATEIS